jgi:hypothetical protein
MLPRPEPVHSLTPILLSTVQPQRNVYRQRCKFLNIISRTDVQNLIRTFMGYIWKLGGRSVVIPMKYFGARWSMTTDCWHCFGRYKHSACRITWLINFLQILLLNTQDKLLEIRPIPILTWKGREPSTEFRTTERAIFILDQSESSGQFDKISSPST